MNPADMEVDDSAEPITVHPPPSSGGRDRRPLVQGPFLFSPAPRELDDESDEGLGFRAADIFLVAGVQATGQSDDVDGKTSAGGIGVLGIAFADGRLDVCLEVEKLEALWVGRQVRVHSLPKSLR